MSLEVEDFYNNIGYGGLSVSKLTSKLRDEFTRVVKPNEAAPKQPEKAVRPDRKAEDRSQSVILDGLEGCDVKFAKCCNPLPGDEIVGFITRGFGVSIHKRSCSNVPKDFSQAPEPERWVRAYWAGEVKEEFKSTLHIVATDRSGLLADVTQQLFNMHIFIHSLNSREIKNSENAVISATITINGLSHLQTVIDRLQKIKGVISIDRS